MSKIRLRASTGRLLGVGMITMLPCCQVAAEPCQRPYVDVYKIQGLGPLSPLTGQTVETRGVVLATLYADSKTPQLLLQSLKPDQNDATSDVILVTDSKQAQQVKPGTVLHLRGTVREINGMTALTNTDNSFAERCGQQPVPEPIPVKLPRQAGDDWERLEGMWLQFPQPLLVNDTYTLARFGEVLVADKRLMVATEVVEPGKAAQQLEAQQQLSELVLDDGSMQQNPPTVPFVPHGLAANRTLRIGDTLRNVEGFIIQTKQGYRLLVSQMPMVDATNPRPAAPGAKAGHDLRIASFNVLNFFTGEGKNPFPTKRGASSAEELARQQAKMTAALAAMDADIIGLLEVQNNGFTDTGALKTLVKALNQQLGGSVYQAIIPPQTPGTDDIMVAMIYRSAAVAPVRDAAIKLDGAFAKGSRVPLAQSFVHLASKQTVTVGINHLKSKGSCPADGSLDSDQQDGQGCWNKTRVDAAAELNRWLASTPTGVKTDYQVIMGDFNAYRKEQPIQALEQAGWVHLAAATDVHTSFVFKGRSGTLDHALASKALHEKLVRFAHWHINADEPEVLDYNVEHKTPEQQQQWYAPTPYRSSDHDPLYMDFRF